MFNTLLLSISFVLMLPIKNNADSHTLTIDIIKHFIDLMIHASCPPWTARDEETVCANATTCKDI